MKPAVLKPFTRTLSQVRSARRKRNGKVTARVPIKLKARASSLKEGDAVGYRTPMEVTQVLELPGRSYYPICPRCKCTIEREYMRFCDRCGQKLGWKNFDDAIVVYPGCSRR